MAKKTSRRTKQAAAETTTSASTPEASAVAVSERESLYLIALDIARGRAVPDAKVSEACAACGVDAAEFESEVRMLGVREHAVAEMAAGAEAEKRLEGLNAQLADAERELAEATRKASERVAVIRGEIDADLSRVRAAREAPGRVRRLTPMWLRKAHREQIARIASLDQDLAGLAGELRGRGETVGGLQSQIDRIDPERDAKLEQPKLPGLEAQLKKHSDALIATQEAFDAKARHRDAARDEAARLDALIMGPEAGEPEESDDSGVDGGDGGGEE